MSKKNNNTPDAGEIKNDTPLTPPTDNTEETQAEKETTAQIPPTLPESETKKNNDRPKPTVEESNLPKYSKQQLLSSSTYSHRRDVLNALLTDDGMYSHADVAATLKEFYEREV